MFLVPAASETAANCNVRDFELIAGFVTTFEFALEAVLRAKGSQIYPSRDFLI